MPSFQRFQVPNRIRAGRDRRQVQELRAVQRQHPGRIARLALTVRALPKQTYCHHIRCYRPAKAQLLSTGRVDSENTTSRFGDQVLVFRVRTPYTRANEDG